MPVAFYSLWSSPELYIIESRHWMLGKPLLVHTSPVNMSNRDVLLWLEAVYQGVLLLAAAIGHTRASNCFVFPPTSRGEDGGRSLLVDLVVELLALLCGVPPNVHTNARYIPIPITDSRLRSMYKTWAAMTQVFIWKVYLRCRSRSTLN